MLTFADTYVDLFQTLPVATTIMDSNGRLLDANQLFCSTEGLNRKSITGRTLLELKLLNFEDSIKLAHAIVTENGKVRDFEVKIVSAQERYVSISVNPSNYPQSNTYIYTFCEVTKYRREQQQLQKNLESLEKITQHLPAMIFSYCRNENGDMSFDYVSKGSEGLIGYDNEYLIKNFSVLWEAIHPEDLIGLTDSVAESARDQTLWEHEYRLKHRDGSYKWVQGRSSPFFKTRGEICWVGAVLDISDRKKIEQEKKQLEERLYHSIEYTPNLAIQWYNRKGEIIYWNKASEMLYGFSSQEALGKTLDKLICNSEKAMQFLNILQEVELTNQPYGPYESEVEGRDGIGRTILATTYKIPGLDDDPVFVCMDFDITQQKLAQYQLVRSEERLRSITEIIPDTVWIMDTEDKIVYKSKDNEELNQKVGEKIQMGHVLSEDLQMVKDGFSTLKANPFSFHKVQYRVCRDNNIIHLETFGTNQFDNPAIQGLVLVTRNITESKRAEEELSSSHYFLETLLDTIPVKVCWKDLELRYLGANKLFLKRLDFISQKQLIGKNDTEVLGLKYSEELLSPDQEVIRNGKALIFYEESHEEDGKLRWLLKSKVPLKDKEDKIIGILVTGQDITERKEAEQKVQLKNEELIRINEELDRFVYSASHDLRAPIASVMGLIEVLKQEKNPLLVQEYLEKQKRALKKMDQFIQDIVHYSRNGRLEVAQEEVDLVKLLEEVLEQHSHLENASMIRMEIKVKNKVPLVTDSQRLSVILSNLISNSIKYADIKKEDPYLVIAAEIDENKLTLSVHDNGEGVEPEYRDKIFEMFFRATTNSTGTGIGLYIVKEIVNKMGGEIRLQSEPGSGSLFSVILPNFKLCHY